MDTAGLGHDGRTIRLILWMVFTCGLLGALLHFHSASVIIGQSILDPIQLQAVQSSADKGTAAVIGTGTVLIALLGRVRTEPPAPAPPAVTPVEVMNGPGDPVPTTSTPNGAEGAENATGEAEEPLPPDGETGGEDIEEDTASRGAGIVRQVTIPHSRTGV